jgi:zinc/manganese transport system substrate-binding protein
VEDTPVHVRQLPQIELILRRCRHVLKRSADQSSSEQAVRRHRLVVGAVAVLAVTLGMASCATTSSPAQRSGPAGSSPTAGVITAVGAENEYANVISQIGGKYVRTTAIMSDPNTDPHTFEASASVATAVRQAALVVQNGVGYDDFMTTIEKAAPNPNRRVIVVQQLLGLPDTTPNPHLWYDPTTMPKVAQALVGALSALQPGNAGYFQANATAFDQSLQPWTNAIAAFKAQFPNTPVATTEPVADYMLTAAGTINLTPMSLQTAIMNGTEPAPQSVTAQDQLFAGHQVKVFVYNQQVTDQLTQSWLTAAKAAGIPVVGVYETMPTPGFDYQSWMLAEVNALHAAVAQGKSTEKL